MIFSKYLKYIKKIERKIDYLKIIYNTFKYLLTKFIILFLSYKSIHKQWIYNNKIFLVELSLFLLYYYIYSIQHTYNKPL